MKSFTIVFDSVKQLLETKNIEYRDTPHTLIQLFCAQANAKIIQDMQEYFKKYFPLSVLIGSTTDGIIDGTEVYVAKQNMLVFSIFEKTSLRSAFVTHEECQFNSYKTGQTMAYKLSGEHLKLMISFADGIHTNGEEYVDGISSVFPDLILAGGLAADNGKLIETFVFDKYHMSSSGAVGIGLYGNELNISTEYAFDWMPIGKKLTITKSIKNRVYEIDGITAVSMYAHYFGQELANQLPQVGIEFPLIFEKNGVSIGRAVLFKHNDDSLTFAGNITEGTEVRFGIGSVETILQNSNYHIGKMLDKLEYQTETTFVYSCMARRRFMKEHISDELEILKKIGQVVGFFTYGEFFHAKNSNRLLNETMTLLSLSENKNPAYKGLKEIALHVNHHEVRAEHVVANLANRVSKELEELNSSLERRIQESSDYIYKQAYFDRLTGLPNRLSLIKKIDTSVGQTIFLINIDDFTSINDFYGFKIGDAVIKKLGMVLQQISYRYNAIVYKLPSDEFAVLMKSFSNIALQEARINEYLAFINQEEFFIGDNAVHVSATIAATYINNDKNGLANADMTLKLAKKAGKNYMIYTHDLNLLNKYRENLLMVHIIKDAISKDGIVPYFQPLYNIKTGIIDKYECLVRLIKEDGEVLSPLVFLEISEKIKLYPQITKIMIEKSFTYFKNKEFSFSINLSFSDILNNETRKYLFEKIKEHDIAKKLTIEILETQYNDDDKALVEFTKEIYKCGANIAIDDFGSGYANFKHITDIQSDFMKIDGSLIKNIDKDVNARYVVETIIVFAKKLNKKVVVEFVHSKEVYNIVKELDIDYTQGYYLGMPLEDTL